MNCNRICPQCGCEYLPHIERCADCHSPLLLYEEYKATEEEKKRVAQQFIENAAVVGEGDLKWITELRNLLIESGIPCALARDEECRSGCRDKFSLVTSREKLDQARERIEEYFAEMHPEIRASRELESQGKCPACGSGVGDGTMECGDCGLPLIIIEEEE
jgi:hypothetical protein